MRLKRYFKWKILFYKISLSCEVAASIGFLRHAALSERRRRRKKFLMKGSQSWSNKRQNFFVHFTSVTRSSSPAPRAISRNTHELIHSLRLSHISLSLSSSLSTFYMTHSLSDMPVLSFFALLPVSSFSFSPHSLPFLDRQFPGKEEEWWSVSVRPL